MLILVNTIKRGTSMFFKKKENETQKDKKNSQVNTDDTEAMLEESFNDPEAKDEVSEDPLKRLNKDLNELEKEIKTTDSSIEKIDKDIQKINKKVM